MALFKDDKIEGDEETPIKALIQLNYDSNSLFEHDKFDLDRIVP